MPMTTAVLRATSRARRSRSDSAMRLFAPVGRRCAVTEASDGSVEAVEVIAHGRFGLFYRPSAGGGIGIVFRIGARPALRHRLDTAIRSLLPAAMPAGGSKFEAKSDVEPPKV